MDLDILTTSVGRSLIQQTYRSLLDNLEFDGRLHVGVVIDPAYGVDEAEISETQAWLEGLARVDARIGSVEVRRFQRNVGLQRAVVTLLSMARARYCLYLEDDWRCLGPVRPRSVVGALKALDAGMIALTSPTAAAHGTFERTAEAIPVEAGGLALFRLQSPSWAHDYMPLHPHIHDARRWPATYLQALMEEDTPSRCPDERVREWVRRNGMHHRCPVYWTNDILFEDIGRDWLAARTLAKDIAPARTHRALPKKPGPSASHARSLSYHDRALKVIPGETQTFMKRRLNFPASGFPVFIDDGDGPFVWDVDGNGYIDMIAGLGALSLGHNHPAVTTAIEAQALKGLIHSLPTVAELEAAEQLSQVFPATPLVRFFKNGGDATAAAIRLARAQTGRDVFLSGGYHGCNDMFMTGSPGVPAALAGLHHPIDPFARSGPDSIEDAFDAHRGRIAALILALPYHRIIDRERLHEIQALVRAEGALLIMDEIVTCFRFPGGSASAHFGLDPDAMCWGKSLGAGVPIAALTMKSEHGPAMATLHISATHGGDALSLAVCRSALAYYRSTNYPNRMVEAGKALADTVNEIAQHARLGSVVHGHPAMPYFRLADDRSHHVSRMRRLQTFAASHGVLLREDVNFVTDGFSPDIVDVAARRIGAALLDCVGEF
ncbi:aminotransferase class III-fold pyridoxal phosphate-dependent enzyme [Bradyrhizobium sp. HKCCYLS3013]|uniref:aminotransferase class III-fold pyridoxal phosphate-dependent enzyme n=1 Tax=Bradyrhizobium sp. HKCCYLS3013 TaxID=3420735 RepID=UPI003EBFE960